MAAFYQKKPLYTKVWRSLKTGITGTDSVRACINDNKENYSIDVTFYKPEDHLSEKQPRILENSVITIDFPNGNTWIGNINDLRLLLAPTKK